MEVMMPVGWGGRVARIYREDALDKKKKVASVVASTSLGRQFQSLIKTPNIVLCLKIPHILLSYHAT